MDIESFLIYGSVLLASCYVANIYERYKIKFYLILSYLIVALFCAFRYDVGWDYLGYVDIFYEIKYFGISYVEPAYFFLNDIFKNCKDGFIYPIGICSVVTIGILFYIYNHENNVWRNVFFLFAFQLIFQINDQIRQGVAMSILWLGFIFLTKISIKSVIKFLLCVIVATLFHLSSIVFSIIPLLYYIRVKYKVWISIISLSFFLSLIGVSSKVASFVNSQLFLYEKYQNTSNIEISTYSNPIIIFFWVLVGIIIACSYKEKNSIIFKLNMIGTTLYPLVAPIHILERMDFYLLFLNGLLAAKICRQNNLYSQLLYILGIFIFTVYALNNWGTGGGYPYKWIFSSIL